MSEQNQNPNPPKMAPITTLELGGVMLTIYELTDANGTKNHYFTVFMIRPMVTEGSNFVPLAAAPALTAMLEQVVPSSIRVVQLPPTEDEGHGG